jgi:hypothetical protein
MTSSLPKTPIKYALSLLCPKVMGINLDRSVFDRENFESTYYFSTNNISRSKTLV